MTEQDLADDMANFGVVDADGRPLQVAEGQQARALIADGFRMMMKAQAGVDLDSWSDRELIDGIEYQVFLYFVPWSNLTVPVTYRFLPGHDVDHGLMEVYVMMPTPPGTPKTRPLHVVQDDDAEWSSVPEMGRWGTSSIRTPRTSSGSAGHEGLQGGQAAVLPLPGVPDQTLPSPAGRFVDEA